MRGARRPEDHDVAAQGHHEGVAGRAEGRPQGRPEGEEGSRGGEAVRGGREGARQEQAAGEDLLHEADERRVQGHGLRVEEQKADHRGAPRGAEQEVTR
ncbi:MAG: hypothetical protein EHM91_18105 [Planctomycetota bacterium]|nr:MAG: hypothetical protein EHM91_18105 [Planctomycetota bacterium]